MLCPACGSASFQEAVEADEIEQEIYLRNEFIREQFLPDYSILKDRLDFVRGPATCIFSCQFCRTLQCNIPTHEEALRRYSGDPRHETMQRVFESHVAEYRSKEEHYLPLFEKGTKVLEVGSYVGSFLRVAEEWGWKATGVDLGRRVTKFARSRGLEAYNLPLESCGFKDSSFDAVFVWNCFDQTPNIDTQLSEIDRVLKPNGTLVLRAPNAAFYLMCRMLLVCSRRLGFRIDTGNLIVKTLGFHRMLGFPFLYGFTAGALKMLMLRFSLVPNGAVSSIASSGLRTCVTEEQKQIDAAIREAAQISVMPGWTADPWLELRYTKASQLRTQRYQQPHIIPELYLTNSSISVNQ